MPADQLERLIAREIRQLDRTSAVLTKTFSGAQVGLDQVSDWAFKPAAFEKKLLNGPEAANYRRQDGHWTPHRRNQNTRLVFGGGVPKGQRSSCKSAATPSTVRSGAFFQKRRAKSPSRPGRDYLGAAEGLCVSTAEVLIELTDFPGDEPLELVGGIVNRLRERGSPVARDH